MESFLDYVDCVGANLFPEQTPKDNRSKLFVLDDASDKEQFTKEHIPGAVNIK